MFNDNVIDVESYPIVFDKLKLKMELGFLLKKYPWHPHSNQLSLVHTGEYDDPADQIYDGIGSIIKPGLDNRLNRVYQEGKEKEKFTHLHPAVKNTYFEFVINKVREFSEKPIGRIRLMMLRSKTCYSWHKDDDLIRYHVPIITNPRCFIVTEHGLYTMETEGKLYSLVSTAMHTAMNASQDDRVHLLFDTI